MRAVIPARELLARLGPGSFLHYGCTDVRLVSALLQQGCDAYGYPAKGIAESLNGRMARTLPARGFHTVLLDPSAVEHAASLVDLMREVRPLVRRNLVVHLPPGANPEMHEALEATAIEAGYRRHPAAFPVPRYERLNEPRAEELTYFEIIPSSVLAQWPLDKLLAERALHMDMTREASARADAHLVRYALAAEWVRPGDRVLDCACGLGYGTAILAASSPGKRFLGVDIDGACIEYAKANFGHYGVDYRCAPAASMGFVADHSVDLVVSFETLEHLEDYEAFIDEVARMMKPDGRVIVSVPNLWVDETGRDPNPHHFHAFDYEKCRAALARRFIVEARFAQTAPGGVKLQGAPRRLEPRLLHQEAREADTEWWIVVASANPLARGKPVAFTHPQFDACTEGTDSVVTAFARHYDNPWIYRPCIQIGERIRDQQVLVPAVANALAAARPDSADRGALLTVRAYAALQENGFAAYPEIARQISDYLTATTGASNPHVARWRISLGYVGALVALGSGHREAARDLLAFTASQNPMDFSPLIATKVVGANFLLGILALVDDEPATAKRAFSRGVEAARQAMHAPDVNAIGNPRQPLAFGFFELAEIADMGGQCATALQALERFPNAPGQFWRAADTKRFGLFSWLKDLEKENAALRSTLAAHTRLRTLLRQRAKELAGMIYRMPAMLSAALRAPRRTPRGTKSSSDSRPT